MAARHCPSIYPHHKPPPLRHQTAQIAAIQTDSEEKGETEDEGGITGNQVPTQHKGPTATRGPTSKWGPMTKEGPTQVVEAQIFLDKRMLR